MLKKKLLGGSTLRNRQIRFNIYSILVFSFRKLFFHRRCIFYVRRSPRTLITFKCYLLGKLVIIIYECIHIHTHTHTENAINVQIHKRIIHIHRLVYKQIDYVHLCNCTIQTFSPTLSPQNPIRGYNGLLCCSDEKKNLITL